MSNPDKAQEISDNDRINGEDFIKVEYQAKSKREVHRVLNLLDSLGRSPDSWQIDYDNGKVQLLTLEY